jgi:hypothetical protein
MVDIIFFVKIKEIYSNVRPILIISGDIIKLCYSSI